MRLVRPVAILSLLVVAFAAAVAVERKEKEDEALERRVDQIFAAYDKPDTPGCALGVIRDGNFLSAADGELVALGTHFKPRDANHFVATPRAEIAFDRLKNGAIRATLTLQNSAPQVLERFEPLKPSAEDLAPYGGKYTSSELQATYRFAMKDGKLTLATNWQEPSVLEPPVRGEFQSPVGVAMAFRRGAAGHITGCDLFAGRVRNIFFTRVAK